MDFFNRALATAKVQAAKAAADAKVMAEQAHAAALQQAEEAQRRLQSLPGEFKSLDINQVTSSMKDSMAKALSGQGATSGAPMEEMVEFGLTEEFVQHVKEFSYMTFREFPEEQLVITKDLSPRSQPRAMKLRPWQAKHAMLLVQAVPEFNDLRYVLCPSKMTEERFWETYFMLNKDRLPEEATVFDILDARNGQTKSAAGAVPASQEVQAVDEALGNFALNDDDDDGEGEDDDDYDYEPYESASPIKTPAPTTSSAPEKASVATGEHLASPVPSHATGEEATSPHCPEAADAKPGSAESGQAASTATPAADSGSDKNDASVGGEGEGDEDEDEDDFDAYVNGMLGGDGDDEDGDDEDVDDEDFDAYMDELAKGAGSGEDGDDADVSLDSQDIDLSEFQDEDED